MTLSNRMTANKRLPIAAAHINPIMTILNKLCALFNVVVLICWGIGYANFRPVSGSMELIPEADST